MKAVKDIIKIASTESEYPIWYYKKLEEVDLDYVTWNLLRESFVVDIHGIKYHFTFGKNKKHELIRSVRFDDLHRNPWLSAELTEKAFREGVWHTISECDTSEEDRKAYRKIKEEKALRVLAEFVQQEIVRAEP